MIDYWQVPKYVYLRILCSSVESIISSVFCYPTSKGRISICLFFIMQNHRQLNIRFYEIFFYSIWFTIRVYMSDQLPPAASRGTRINSSLGIWFPRSRTMCSLRFIQIGSAYKHPKSSQNFAQYQYDTVGTYNNLFIEQIIYIYKIYRTIFLQFEVGFVKSYYCITLRKYFLSSGDRHVVIVNRYDFQFYAKEAY